MPMTKGRALTKEEQASIGAAIHDVMIEEYLDGLRRIPALLAMAKSIADHDPAMAEAVRRYEAGDDA